MATNIKSTDLDFNRIKEQLKTHFLASSEFADYDFEASGLSSILDVLAYNTHYNGLIANFALNESFLTTAQLRSSVLAVSESLGYTPRSKTSAQATVNISVTVSDESRPATITLPSATTFTATVEDVSYVFQTIEDHIGSDDGSGVYQFATSQGNPLISLYEGQFKTKTFISDQSTNPVYVIPDADIDISTATVKVFATRNSSTFDTYLPLSQAQTVDENSTYYSLREGPNGYYELIFGDGITTGKTPSTGEVIQVTYLKTSSSAANTANVFVPQNEITVNDTDYTISVTTQSRASGGADKESIESIKANAPISFAAQNRLVTAQDYVALINRNYGSFLDDVTAWGGEDNIPADFGNVYVSLKYKTGTTDAVKQVVQDSIITSLSDNLSIMSIDTKFTEATTTYIETQTFFNFDPSLTGITLNTTSAQVQTLIDTYFVENLNKFNKTFRRSAILADIDDLSPAILDSRMNVKVQQRFTPILSRNLNYTIQYPVALADSNSDTYVVTSSSFTLSGRTCSIRNKLNSSILEVVSAEGDIIVTNVGSYNTLTGKIDIVGFQPTAITGGATFIKMSALPANQATIRPLRNYVLDIDDDASFASAQIDYQEIKATL